MDKPKPPGSIHSKEKFRGRETSRYLHPRTSGAKKESGPLDTLLLLKQKWEVLAPFFWTLLALLYGGACLVATFYAGKGEPKEVILGFFVFGFLYFLMGYFWYFYPLTAMSPNEKQREKERRLKLPAYIKWKIPIYLGLGGLTTGIFWFFQVWRAGR